jgi:hypothetical protein
MTVFSRGDYYLAEDGKLLSLFSPYKFPDTVFGEGDMSPTASDIVLKSE